MVDSSDPDIRRYHVTVSDRDSEYDIVLPGRSETEARRAAELLLAAVGPRAFSPKGLDAPFLSLDEAARLTYWLSTYDRIAELYHGRRAMAEYYELIEFQIAYVMDRNHAEIDAKSYRRFEQQKAARTLPDAIVAASSVQRGAGNPFEPRSTLMRETIDTARTLTQVIEKGRPESDALRRDKRNAYIAARIAISRQADREISETRARVNAMFKPHWRDLARQASHARLAHSSLRGSFFKTAEPVVLALPAIAVARKLMEAIRNTTLRDAVAPILEAKRDYLRVQDSSYRSFVHIDTIASRIETQFMQEQWRKLVAVHARQLHGPESAKNAAPSKPGANKSFFDRIAEAARSDPAPPLAAEQNNNRDQERE